VWRPRHAERRRVVVVASIASHSIRAFHIVCVSVSTPFHSRFISTSYLLLLLHVPLIHTHCNTTLLLYFTKMAMAVAFSLSSPSSALFQSRHSFAKCLASKQNSPLQMEQMKSRDNAPITLHSFSPFPLLCAAALLPGGKHFPTFLFFLCYS